MHKKRQNLLLLGEFYGELEHIGVWQRRGLVDIMKRYLKENAIVLILLLALIMLSAPFFSVIMSMFSKYLNLGLGDWLSFYGTIAGIVISLIVVHFQLSLEGEREIQKYRPEIVLSNDYQLIKPDCRIYFDDKHWFHLVKTKNQNKHVEANSFEKSYAEKNKRDKVLSLEIVNNQPIFNIHIVFGEDMASELIPKISVDQRLYVVSKAHQKEIHSHLIGNTTHFTHVPNIIVLYFTTLSGEICEYRYKVDSKGYCNIEKKYHGINYPKTLIKNHLCDYFISK
ncbi:hypothetical protein [Streptococcus minor]|uniref:hypothetical protein n=1 Tax=Streptococcus minor TaxID=229549 RepID=UPI001FDF11A9|nr:hypothetical protein [Streptococcus minor]